jgi:hypothetical protein
MREAKMSLCWCKAWESVHGWELYETLPELKGGQLCNRSFRVVICFPSCASLVPQTFWTPVTESRCSWFTEWLIRVGEPPICAWDRLCCCDQFSLGTIVYTPVRRLDEPDDVGDVPDGSVCRPEARSPCRCRGPGTLPSSWAPSGASLGVHQVPGQCTHMWESPGRSVSQKEMPTD